MSSNQTENLNLHQWEKTDIFSRTEFNENFSKIDTALAKKAEKSEISDVRTYAAGKCEMISGTFNGNGTETRVIQLGMRPKVVIICSSANMFASLVVGSVPMGPVRIVDNGFQVGTGGNIPQNLEGVRYHYLALR